MLKKISQSHYNMDLGFLNIDLISDKHSTE